MRRIIHFFPLILKAFHKIGQRYNCQIVATTHSYEIIDSLVKGLSGKDLSDVTYIRLDKEKEQIKPRIYESSILAATFWKRMGSKMMNNYRIEKEKLLIVEGKG